MKKKIIVWLLVISLMVIANIPAMYAVEAPSLPLESEVVQTHEETDPTSELVSEPSVAETTVLTVAMAMETIGESSAAETTEFVSEPNVAETTVLTVATVMETIGETYAAEILEPETEPGNESTTEPSPGETVATSTDPAPEVGTEPEGSEPTGEIGTDDGDDAQGTAPELQEPIVEMTVFARLMACTTLDELDLVFEDISEEDWNALTDEQMLAIGDLILEIKQLPKSETVIITSEPPVESEVVILPVNYSNVAPFVDPVVGG